MISLTIRMTLAHGFSAADGTTSIDVCDTVRHVVSCGDHTCRFRTVSASLLIAYMIAGIVALLIARRTSCLISLIVAAAPTRIKSGTESSLIRAAAVSSGTGTAVHTAIPLTAAIQKTSISTFISIAASTMISIATHTINLSFSCLYYIICCESQTVTRLALCLHIIRDLPLRSQ